MLNLRTFGQESWLAPKTMATGVLVDAQIAELCREPRAMIATEYVGQQRRRHGDEKILSYGLSSHGYDFRLSNKFLVPKMFSGIEPSTMTLANIARFHEPTPLNLKTYDPDNYYERVEIPQGENFIIPAGGVALGVTMEWVDMPDDVKIDFIGKSTWARCFASIYITPVEVGFYGSITLEIHNASPWPVCFFPGEGIVQGQFTKLNCVPDITYRQKKGKYNGIQFDWPVPPKL